MKSVSDKAYKIGLASLLMMGGCVSVALSQPASKLTLYGGENFQGDSRVITSDQSNLSSVKADNFAYSLKAVGRWEVCMDAGHRAGCFEVNGDLADLGSNGGSISSVRRLGPVSAATSQTSAPPPSVATGPVMAGRIYRSDWGDMTVASWQPGFAATFAHEDGRVDGAVLDRKVSGHWYQSSSAMQCGTPKGGTYYWGTYTFEFNPDFSTYKGLWGYCEETPYQKWDGVQVGGPTGMGPVPVTQSVTQPVTGAVSGSVSAAVTTVPETDTSDASETESQGTPQVPGVVGRIGQRAADATEREVGDRVEEKVGKAIGKIFGQ